MSNPNQAYAAVITLSPPEAQGQVTIQVRLTPGDAIGAEGERRPLGDYTLAELQNYADQLERTFWAANKDRTLADLLQDEHLKLEVSLVGITPNAELSTESLLEQIILLDQPDAPAGASPESTSQPPPTLAPAETAPPAPSTPSALTQPEATSAAAEAALPHPAIAVAETQPVRPEKEASLPRPRPAQPAIRTAGLVRRLGHPTEEAVDILIDEPAFNAAKGHALTSLNREVAGMLIGPPPEKQPDGRYVVHITDALVARHTRMSGASVTYTPESWRDIHDQIAALYPADSHVILGWYHTHPGFGIFLSNMDLFIHTNFFTQLWHVALVLDPRAHTAGFFCWDRRQKQVRSYPFPWPDWAPDGW